MAKRTYPDFRVNHETTGYRCLQPFGFVNFFSRIILAKSDKEGWEKRFIRLYLALGTAISEMLGNWLNRY